MNELLRKRIDRHLENLSDDQGYLLLDFVEFLESKYGEDVRRPSAFERISEGMENAMRAGRVPVVAIRETMNAMDKASRLMQKLADAGRSAVNELNRSLASSESQGSDAEAASDGASEGSDGGDEAAAPEEEPERRQAQGQGDAPPDT